MAPQVTLPDANKRLEALEKIKIKEHKNGIENEVS